MTRIFKKTIATRPGQNSVDVELSADEIQNIQDREEAWLKEYLKNKYKEDRAREYLPIQDQLDQIWHAIDQNKLDKTSKFYTTIKAVKDKYPKPTNK